MVGKTLSHYKIIDELGRGGMGIVYKAQDTKLDRAVAIKILPAAALSNEGDRARFYREAKAAAALTHPHIAIIHGVDEAVPEGASSEELRPFIAMEYIDGETLEDVIEKGPLKLDDAIRITIQVAGALQLAHENEIVHRDIKSANVMLAKKGGAKVLDFGLAQTAQSTKLTRMGSTLGTVTFMSPEQARGEEVDRRTDIFSLGVMLYHMVTGTMAFGAEYEQAVIYSIINQDPEPITALRTGVPMELERIVNKCLAKDANRRYQHADDLIADLEGVDLKDIKTGSLTGGTTQISTSAVASSPSKMTWHWPVIAAVAFVVGSAATWFATGGGSGAASAPRVESMSRVTIESTAEMHPSLSPDGDRVVYAAGDPEDKRLYYRLIEGGPPIRLTEGSDDEYYPSYSPDGNLIVFSSNGSIYTVEALGGAPRPVLTRGPGRQFYEFATWSPDGTQLALASFADSLYIMDIASGRFSFTTHFSQPHSLAWSPDGRFLAFVGENGHHARSGDNLAPSIIWILNLSSGERHQLSSLNTANLSPRWSPDSDAIYYVSDQFGGRDIYRQEIQASGTAEGAPVRVTTGLNIHSFGISVDGNRIVASDLHFRQNIWAWPLFPDRAATSRDAFPITTGDQVIERHAFSPDGERIAYDSNAKGISHLYVVSKSGGTPLQVTDRDVSDFIYDWSPYSNELSFHTFSGGVRTIGIVSADDLRADFLPEHQLHERFPFWLENENTLAFHREIGPDTYNLQRSRRDASGVWSNPEIIIEPLREGATYSTVRDQIAYTYRDGVYVWDRKTAESSLVVQTQLGVPYQTDWSPDGSTIYFFTHSATGTALLNAVPADGGPVRIVVDFNGPNKPRYSVQVDEENVYGSMVEVEGDIWVLDLSQE